jgi:hypothetical protein
MPKAIDTRFCMKKDFAVNVLFCVALLVLFCCAGANITIPGLTPEVDLEVAVQEFHAWFDANYKIKRQVKLTVAGDGMRLGVVATQDIPAESLYLSIPMNIIIYDDTIFRTPLVGPAIQRVLKRVSSLQRFQPQQLALNLFLTHERFVAQRKSFFHPYIQLIPSEHDVPEFYSNDDLALLKGTLIPSKVQSQRRRHREDYNALVAALRSEQSVFPLHTFSYENYAWAQGILNTRMIWWDGVPHLVPLLDMINCRQGPNPYRVHSTKRGMSNRADTLAPWAFHAGDQVFENYGQPNPTYFLWHGFAMEPNVHDCAQVSPGSSFWTKASQEHQRIAQRLQLVKSEFCVRPEASKWEDFLILARVVVMTESDATRLNAPPRNLVSRVNEGKALTLVKKSIEATLATMISEQEIEDIVSPKPSDDDTNGTVPFRKRMIQIFLKTQRKLLVTTAAAIETRIAPLRRKKGSESPKSKTALSDNGEL